MEFVGHKEVFSHEGIKKAVDIAEQKAKAANNLSVPVLADPEDDDVTK